MGKDRSYDELLDYLYDCPFSPKMEMDENRAEDGIELRWQFCYERGYDRDDILDEIGKRKKCTMLEMMVALAQRCESQITMDMDDGVHTERWFYPMLESLGLSGMKNRRLDEKKADGILHRFLSRQYTYFGEGSLFTVNNPKYDMRKTDLWYQAMWYIAEHSSREL